MKFVNSCRLAAPLWANVDMRPPLNIICYTVEVVSNNLIRLAHICDFYLSTHHHCHRKLLLVLVAAEKIVILLELLPPKNSSSLSSSSLCCCSTTPFETFFDRLRRVSAKCESQDSCGRTATETVFIL